MTKKIINEAQLVKIIEMATRESIKNILKEGAGLDTMAQSFKRGLKGTNFSKIGSDGNVVSNMAKDYIKNGDDANWEDFKDYRDFYNRARNVHKNKQAILKNKKNDSNSYTVNDIDKSQHQVDTAKRRRNSAANNMVGSRPGIIGKGQRAANVAAYRTGKGIKKAKDAVTDFVHDKIGLEENKKK